MASFEARPLEKGKDGQIFGIYCVVLSKAIEERLQKCPQLRFKTQKFEWTVNMRLPVAASEEQPVITFETARPVSLSIHLENELLDILAIAPTTQS